MISEDTFFHPERSEGSFLRPQRSLAALGMTAIAVVALVLASVFPAVAHVTSTGLASLDVDGGKLLYRITVITSEIDDPGSRLLAKAADGDRAAAERVAGFVRDYARFAIVGDPCQPGRITIRGSSAGEGKVVLEMALSCPKSSGVLAIHDDWPEVLGAHFQTVLSVRPSGRPSAEFAFLEDKRSATVDLESMTDTGWTSFIVMGVEHILGGIDHLM